MTEQQEQLRVVLAHVVELRAEVERLSVENAELRKSLDTWVAIHGPQEPKP